MSEFKRNQKKEEEGGFAPDIYGSLREGTLTKANIGILGSSSGLTPLSPGVDVCKRSSGLSPLRPFGEIRKKEALE